MKRLFLALALTVIPFSAHAAKISNAEYVALSAHNAVAVHQQEVDNRTAYDANQNPLANGGLERLASPYDLSDAFYDTNGYPLPGWAGSFYGSGGGGDDPGAGN